MVGIGRVPMIKTHVYKILKDINQKTTNISRKENLHFSMSLWGLEK